MYCGSPVEFNISLEDDGVFDDKQTQYSIGSFSNFGDAFLGKLKFIMKFSYRCLSNDYR
jgi:hypothetical protein